MKEIVEVTTIGINYVDENGNRRFIDFEVCYQNFLANRQKNMGPQYSDELKQLDRTYRSVGYRKFSAIPPYIEFYTAPPTRFEFPIRGRFEEITYRIRKAGWLTIDGD